jgi:lipoprotein-anchoring transpeptidase ErfK/SrfK
MRKKGVFSALGLVILFAGAFAPAPQGAKAGPFIARGGGPNEPEAIYSPVGADASQSALGGGFLEMLVTGQNPAYRYPRYANAPVQQTASPSQIEMRREINPAYRRQVVEYSGGQPGQIVIDTQSKYLYYVEGQGRAIRYGIGVGRPGFVWSGVKTISRKAEWPDWTPPAEMIARRPDLPRFMPGGPENPLGARALYLGSSLYRIHGTNEPYTIGQNVSSGCIRMMNEDVTDLYDRVSVGARVVVR